LVAAPTDTTYRGDGPLRAPLKEVVGGGACHRLVECAKPGRRALIDGCVAAAGQESQETPAGSVALAVRWSGRRDSDHENQPPIAPADPAALHLRRFRFPPEVIVVAVRWYARFGLP
jgi:hypothetical protein